MLAKFFAPMAVKILAGISAFLLILCVGFLIRGNHYRHDRDQWKLAFNNQKAAYVAAQDAAKAQAIAAKMAAEARYRVEAERADNEYQTALARAQRASDAYAARMRPQTTSGASGPASPAPPGDSPQSPDRSRQDAVLVGRDDFDILVENSVRLEAAHNWAKTLNQPLPDPAFGQPESEKR